MAEKRKGCGFLIAALVATVIAVIVGVMGIKSGVDDIKDTSENALNGSVTLTTPGTATFKATQDKDATVWLASSGSTAPAKPSGYTVKAVAADGKEITTTKTAATVTVMNQVQLASFPATKDSTYTVSVTGLPDGSVVEVSHSSLSEVMGGAAKAAGGFFGALAIGFVAFVLGLIGLIRWLSSKPKPAAAPPAA